MFQTLAERAWFAWHCLPRNKRDKPPPIRKLEIAHGLANAALRKIILGYTLRPAHDSLLKAALALNCDPRWLSTGEGQGPLASTFVAPGPPPLPARSRGLSSSDVALFEGKAEKLGKRSAIRPRKIARK